MPIRAKSTKPSGRIAFALREMFSKSSGTGIDWFAKNRRLPVLGIVVLPTLEDVLDKLEKIDKEIDELRESKNE